MKSEEQLKREWEEEAEKSRHRERAYAIWCLAVAMLIAADGVAFSLVREYVIWFR